PSRRSDRRSAHPLARAPGDGAHASPRVRSPPPPRVALAKSGLLLSTEEQLKPPKVIVLPVLHGMFQLESPRSRRGPLPPDVHHWPTSRSSEKGGTPAGLAQRYSRMY